VKISLLEKDTLEELLISAIEHMVKTLISAYDVNSLYPHAMKNPMPYKIIKHHKDMSNIIKLEDFFGFCLAEVTTPKNIDMCLLPYKHQGKTIFPKGTWLGVYFSEELKEVVKQGYQFIN